MNKNIIDAIINIVSNPILELKEYALSKNRANSMGGALEEYIKDIFANTINEKDLNIRNKKISETFSYLGNQNNPPDCIIRGGDAIEVKKIESYSSGLALNSSYPKAKLFENSKMITDSCRNCEVWDVKDIIYIIGVCKNDKLSTLCMVYGMDYAASKEIYTKIKDVLTKGINSINDVEFSETKELGRINRVDPLGITYLRIRGMWGIENPLKVFDYLYKKDDEKFNLMVLINDDKYKTFYNKNLLEKLKIENNKFNIDDVYIKTPDNPAILRPAKLIKFSF